MEKRTEHQARGPRNAFAPSGRGTVRDPAVARILDEIKHDEEIAGHVLRDMLNLRRLGVEVTVEIAERSIANARQWLQDRQGPVFVPKRLDNPGQRRPGRFDHIDNPGEVVYYMRIGDRVKIGWSASLRRRLENFNPEELMALERGGQTVESKRHRQFAHLRTHGEWFRLEGSLLDHINKLRAIE